MNKTIKRTLGLLAYALLSLLLPVNFANGDDSNKKGDFNFAYNRVSYVDTELPVNFNPNSFREKCLKNIKLLQKNNFKDNFRSLDYYYFVPDKHNLKKGGKVPLVVFLHGMAEKGKDVKVLFRHPQSLIFIDPENQKKYPCYLVAPQISKWGSWVGSSDRTERENSETMQAVIDIIRTMQKNFPDIDKDRIYVTGLSSGGHGSCEALMKNPGVFAGIVPIAGGLFRGHPTAKQKVGIWAFWNDNEHAGTRKDAIKTLKDFAALGADARYTKFHPNNKPRFSRHLSWAWAYAEPNLIPWLFSHKRDKEGK